MASLYPKIKDGKIISFKFKTVVGKDKNGKQVTRCTTWTPEKSMSEKKLKQQAEKEATIWERAVQEEYRRELLEFKPTFILFKDFVETVWMPTQINELRPTTLEFRRYLLKVILPYFNDKPLAEIKSVDIESFIQYLRNTYKTQTNTPPSPQTIRHHYCTLNRIFEYAVRLEYIDQNPVEKVETPKLIKHKVDALSESEVAVFIKAVNELPLKLRLMYMLLLTTGMRRGECFGLQWNDVDLDNAIINIHRNVTYTVKTGICIGYPKTSSGERVIPITRHINDLLQEYYRIEKQLYAIEKRAYLFQSEESPYTPHDPTYISKHMTRFMKRIGLPDLSPHDLRHPYIKHTTKIFSLRLKFFQA